MSERLHHTTGPSSLPPSCPPLSIPHPPFPALFPCSTPLFGKGVGGGRGGVKGSMWRSVALLLIGVSALIQVSLQGPHQRTLLKELLKDYNRMERPVANDSLPLTVNLSMILVQIMDVDEKNQVLTTNIWLQMHWYDHYLQWNHADDKFDSTFKTNVKVNSNGFCQYLPPGIFMSTCNVDVRWFPFDIQKCELKFGSWTFDGWLLDLQMSDADISGYMPNGEWDLVGVPGSRNEVYYDCCKEPYPDVTFIVTIRRRTLYYALNLLIPCVLLSSMTLLIFLLPADSGEKISLGQYFASIMIIVGMSVIATVVVLQYHHHDPNGGSMPKWVQLILLQWVAWFLRMKRPGESDDPERPPCAPHLRRCSSGSQSGSLPNPPGPSLHPLHPQNHASLQPGGLSHPGHAHLHTQSSANNGNLLYIGFQNLDDPPLVPDPTQRNSAISQRAVPGGVAGSPPPHLPAQFCSPPPPTPNLDTMGCSSTVSSGFGLGGVGGPGCLVASQNGMGGGDPQLQAILEEVRFVADRFREQDENEGVAEQWKFAAAVIDRLCLVAFSVFNIICTISILMSAPNFVEAVSKDFI
ncbi:hypothetical protein JZ751_000172 [Albula glossodonta]|uniref:Neuronal acetylcholine receptor subunit alpha-7-like n=1 Tax=Albula glossodonta TaxID=121402 RepID=A0A8T2PVL8_9TELE|nr:hypothetical protein JZ751_000172 [Albula glossodonta]